MFVKARRVASYTFPSLGVADENVMEGSTDAIGEFITRLIKSVLKQSARLIGRFKIFYSFCSRIYGPYGLTTSDLPIIVVHILWV